MREFKSLQPVDLADTFDAEIHGEDPIVDINEAEGRIVVQYTFPGFYMLDDSRDVDGEEVSFTQINIASTGFFTRSGKPLLPSFGRYVQIPFNCDYTFTVEKGNPVQFDDVLVLPAQEQLTDSPNQGHIFEYDRQFYAQDGLYPEQIVEITGPFAIDDYAALLVHVVPFQYNPAKRRLTGYGNITVTIHVTPKDAVDAPPPADPELNREAYGNLFLNPGRSIVERLEVGPVEVARRHNRLRGPEFLIIYHNTFKSAAERLARWKNMRGLRTEIISIGSIGNSVSQIKTYIRDKRAGFSRLRYVLLFGDVDMIASYDTSTEPWGAAPWPDFWGNNVTDYYYSTERDPTGPADYVLPWLSIGRIPVRTSAEGADVVGQIISYERRPPTSPDYYNRMAFAAYFQGDGTATRAYMKTMENIRQHMITLGFDVERIYVSETGNVQFYVDGTPVPADVVASIVDSATATNELIAAATTGQLIAAHRDHGLDTGWHEPPFDKSHLDSVTGRMPTLFFSVNCLTGEFDLTAPTESFAEKILRMKGAAPSLIAATRVSHTWLNNDLMKALFDATWGGVLPTFPGATASYPVRHNRLGDILNYGKAYLPVVKSGSGEYIKDHYEIYHIIGDPTLEIWRHKPRRARIRTWVTGRFLHIQLYRSLKDCVITIWYKDKMLRRLEPSSTYMVIALPRTGPHPWPPRPAPGDKLSVCFWAPGYRFREIRPTI
jgi:hypothetical protein